MVSILMGHSFVSQHFTIQVVRHWKAGKPKNTSSPVSDKKNGVLVSCGDRTINNFGSYVYGPAI